MKRPQIWQQLRAAVRAGELERAHELVRALGFTQRETAEMLIEKIWKQVSRERRL